MEQPSVRRDDRITLLNQGSNLANAFGACLIYDPAINVPEVLQFVVQNDGNVSGDAERFKNGFVLNPGPVPVLCRGPPHIRDHAPAGHDGRTAVPDQPHRGGTLVFIDAVGKCSLFGREADVGKPRERVRSVLKGSGELRILHQEAQIDDHVPLGPVPWLILQRNGVPHMGTAAE